MCSSKTHCSGQGLGFQLCFVVFRCVSLCFVVFRCVSLCFIVFHCVSLRFVVFMVMDGSIASETFRVSLNESYNIDILVFVSR